LEYSVTIESFVEHSYDDDLRQRLVRICDDETGTVDEVTRLNVALAEIFADVAQRAWKEAGMVRDDVDLIGSHGQTVWHIAEEESLPGGARSRSTLQIGDGSVITDRTGVPTVSDFRMRDVAAGGHGAPLAPFIDVVQFASKGQSRAIQNIGGIGNCTLLPADPSLDDVRAFDTGPGNMVIDAAVELLTNGEQTYDVDGQIAAGGTVHDGLVDEFLDDEYFQEEPPKSTGREYFGHAYAERFIESGRDRGLSDEDIVTSATALTARSIADAYERFATDYPDEIYVSGGGAYNPTLLRMLETETDGPVSRLSDLGMDGDRKEAGLFALLAVTFVDDVPNNVPTATGTNASVIMGKLSKP
jgi:anhydro-N-acetylmuramic acid kinase